MKKTIFILFLASLNFASAQSKKEILLELQSYFINTTYNISYNIEKEKIFDAIKIACSERYGSSIKENFNKGILDFYIQNESYKESLSFEIIGEQKNFRLLTSFKIEQRFLNNGIYSEWTVVNNYSPSYLPGIHYKIYLVLFGPIPIPNEIMDKINSFNELQKKEKNKILKGKDY